MGSFFFFYNYIITHPLIYVNVFLKNDNCFLYLQNKEYIKVFLFFRIQFIYNNIILYYNDSIINFIYKFNMKNFAFMEKIKL